jgi:hypothetical protein
MILWQETAALRDFEPSDDRYGLMLSKKGFCDEWRATSIQDQMQMRNLDSKIRPPGFDRFKF